MKKLILFMTLLAFVGMTGVNGQELIIEEDFQEWEPTETTNPDTCWLGNINEYKTTRTMFLKTTGGWEEITVRLTMVVIMPDCDSRRIYDTDPPGSVTNLPGVTTGWVQLNKLTDGDPDIDIPITMNNLEDSPDTLGEFIFGPIPRIDYIEFAHSNTGGQRGIRVYKSSDGEDWENASPDDEFWDGADCQRGDTNTVQIGEYDVYIKFTSGFKQSDLTSQYSRLHNIKVYGTPGVLKPGVGINNTKEDILKIYPVPAEDYVNIELAAEAVNSELQIFDLIGRSVYSSIADQQTSTIDISNLNSGMYYIQVTTNADKYVKQLIVK